MCVCVCVLSHIRACSQVLIKSSQFYTSMNRFWSVWVLNFLNNNNILNLFANFEEKKMFLDVE